MPLFQAISASMLRIEDYPSSVDNFHGLKWYLVIKEFFSSARFHKVLVISAFWRIVWNGRVSRMAHELPSFSLCSSARVAVEKGWRVGCNPSLSLVISVMFCGWLMMSFEGLPCISVVILSSPSVSKAWAFRVLPTAEYIGFDLLIFSFSNVAIVLTSCILIHSF